MTWSGSEECWRIELKVRIGLSIDSDVLNGEQTRPTVSAN